MAGKAKKRLMDGRWVTVAEAAAELGCTAQQIYSQMCHRRASLQVVANLIRENHVRLNGSGGQGAERWMVDGRWTTVRDVAAALGVSPMSIYKWRDRNRLKDGTKPPLADAVRAYREGRVRRCGHPFRQHRVGRRTMTVAEAAEMLGVSINAVRLHMSRYRDSLEQTVKYYEARRIKKAEKDILAILMEGKT